MALKSEAKFKGKVTCGLKNDIRNLDNFHASSRKFEKLPFDGLLLSKAYKVLDKKIQKCYISWHWGVIQNLKKNQLFVWKMTWGSWWILTRAVESLKNFTLMSSFVEMLELKNTNELLWKMTYGFKNDIRNLANFHTSTWK